MQKHPLAMARSDPDYDLTLESIETTARALDCSRRTVYTLIERGELRTVHVGRRHLVPRGERLRYVQAQLERER